MIVHTVPVIGIAHEGPSYSVPALCEALIASGIETVLAVLDVPPGSSAPRYVKRFPLGWGPRKLGCSPAMERYLAGEVRSGRAQLIHNHGLWMMPNVYPGRVRPLGHAPLVVSPRGTMSAWAMRHHRWRKRVLWYLGQAATVSRADAFHATGEAEYADIRRLGYKQPVAVIPNGIDVPPLAPKRARSPRRLLFLGRIHKKKGIDVLLRAWRAVQDRFTDWELVIAGPDDGGYLQQFQKLSVEISAARVSFPGAVYGAEKLALYRSADLYVLPTHSDNFALTVAEALAAGTPVIVTKGAPWSGVREEDAGWWIEIGSDPLIVCLQEALASPAPRLAQMGANGHAWMAREYSWESVGQKMADFYRWLRTGAQPAPDWVRL